MKKQKFYFVLVWLLATTAIHAQVNSTTTTNQMPCTYRTEGILGAFNEAMIRPIDSANREVYDTYAIPASRLTLDTDGSVYFIGKNGHVYGYVWDTGLGWKLIPLVQGQWAKLKPEGGLVVDAAHKLYGIGTDGKAYCVYPSGGSWGFGALCSTQGTPLDPRAGLVVDGSGVIYGVGTNGWVYKYVYIGSPTPFSFTLLVSGSGQWADLDPAAKLVYEASSGKLYGIGADGKAYCFYNTGSWNFGVLHSSQPVPFSPSCALVPDGAGVVYGVGTDGKAYSLTYTGGSPPFAWAQLCTQSVNVDPVGQLTYEPATGKIYAIGTDGKVYNFYKPSPPNWTFAVLKSTQSPLTNPAGGLHISNGKIYCIGTDGKVDYFYWQSPSWQFSALTADQKVVADAAVGVQVNNRVVYCAGTRSPDFTANHLNALYYKAEWVDPTGWDIALAEDFDRSCLACTTFTNDWIPHYSWGRTNNYFKGWQWEYNLDEALSLITDPNDPNDKCLRITAGKDPVYKRVDENLHDTVTMEDGFPNKRWFNFTSGAITSQDPYQYGLFEMSAKLPAGVGFWPAFWLFGSAELDIMEAKGSTPYEASNNVIWSTEHASMEYKSANYTSSYHLFSMLWTPNFITFYVDGNELRTVDHHVPQVGLHIIANLAVGLEYPIPYPNAGYTPFPSYMDIDFINVYQTTTYPSVKSLEMVNADEPDTKMDDLVIYPNPGKDIFTLALQSSEASVVEVYNMQGNLVRKTEMLNQCILDLSGQAKGTYVVKITTGNKQVSKKIVLE